MARMVAPGLPAATHLTPSQVALARRRPRYDHGLVSQPPNSPVMQRLSIARSLRLALVVMTLALAVVAALGIAALYNARQRYEDRLTATASLATAGANLAGGGVAEEEVLRDARGATAATDRGRMGAAYDAAAASAASLAR